MSATGSEPVGYRPRTADDFVTDAQQRTTKVTNKSPPASSQRPGGTLDPARDVLVFRQVPKTASTSIAAAVIAALGADRCARLPDWHADGMDTGLWRAHDQLRRRLVRLQRDVGGRAKKMFGRPDAISDAVFLHGHQPLWGAIRNPRRTLDMIVFRDPVDRFQSLYYYFRAKAERSNSSKGNMSQEKGNILRLDPNEYVAWLSTAPVARRLNGHCLFLSRAISVDEAIAALDTRIALAATIDDMPRIAERLAAIIGVARIDIERLNSGTLRPRSNALTPRSEATLRAILEPDYRLFDHVQANKDRYLSQPRAP